MKHVDHTTIYRWVQRYAPEVRRFGVCEIASQRQKVEDKMAC
jgi:transposase-like protein